MRPLQLGFETEKEFGMAKAATARGSKYVLNIEGAEYDWHESTITLPQLRQVAGWESGQEVVEVDLDDNSERTLGEDEVIRLKPGRAFAKKIKFQRG